MVYLVLKTIGFSLDNQECAGSILYKFNLSQRSALPALQSTGVLPYLYPMYLLSLGLKPLCATFKPPLKHSRIGGLKL